MSIDVIVAVSDPDELVADWLGRNVDRILADHGTVNARVAGTSTDEQWGTEYARWWAVSFETSQAERLAQGRVGDVAWRCGQDAIAWTSGATALVPNPERALQEVGR